MPRLRNVAGYPSTALGIQRRREAATAQKNARMMAIGALRLSRAPRAPVIPGVSRVAGFYGRYSGSAPELKFFDTALTFSADATAEVGGTAVLGQVSLIPQGVTQSTRVGRKATVMSIYTHGIAVFVPAAAATASTNVYMYLIQDTQTNGAAATISGDTGIFTSNQLHVANMNLANGQRFKILKKWVMNFTSPAGATTAYNNVSKTWQFYKKCQIPIEYDAAADTGALTTIRSNNIFFAYGTDGQSDDLVTFVGTCRLRFAD